MKRTIRNECENKMSDEIKNSEIMKGLEDFLDRELIDEAIGLGSAPQKEVQDPIVMKRERAPQKEVQDPIVMKRERAPKKEVQDPIVMKRERAPKKEVQDPIVMKRERAPKKEVQDPIVMKRETSSYDEDEAWYEEELKKDYKKIYEKEKAKQEKKMAKKQAKKLSKKDIKKAAREDARRDAKKKGGKGEKKSHGFRNFVLFLLILLLLAAGALYVMVGSAYRNMKYEEIESERREPMKEEGVINILLIGNDSRQDGEDGRSDAMILLSISDNKKTITMTSLLRDMYVEIPGHGGNRLNAAYAYGGPELLMDTIEQNLGIRIHRYMLVNFQAFANLVEAVGGVDLELSNEEVQWVNAYLNEYNELEGNEFGTYYLDAGLSGRIHLNGPQALAYSRNRYIGTDFGRTERQRKVLNEVMKKLPMTVLTNYKELETGLFPNLTTNLKQGECYNLTLNAWKFLSYDSGQLVVPAEDTYSFVTISGMSVVQVDFEENKRRIREALYR